MRPGPRSAIVPPRQRRLALLAALICGLIVASAGVRYHQDANGGRFDHAVGSMLAASSDSTREWLAAVSAMGSPMITVAAIATLLVWTLTDGRRSAAVFAVVAPVLAAVSTEYLLKPWIGRTLDGDLAFPSGHAVRAFAIAFVVALVMVRARRPRSVTARIAISLAAVGVAAAVAVSLAALGWHYASDVVAGALFAGALVLGCALVIDLVSGRRGVDGQGMVDNTESTLAPGT